MMRTAVMAPTSGLLQAFPSGLFSRPRVSVERSRTASDRQRRVKPLVEPVSNWPRPSALDDADGRRCSLRERPYRSRRRCNARYGLALLPNDDQQLSRGCHVWGARGEIERVWRDWICTRATTWPRHRPPGFHYYVAVTVTEIRFEPMLRHLLMLSILCRKWEREREKESREALYIYFVHRTIKGADVYQPFL